MVGGLRVCRKLIVESTADSPVDSTESPSNPAAISSGGGEPVGVIDEWSTRSAASPRCDASEIPLARSWASSSAISPAAFAMGLPLTGSSGSPAATRGSRWSRMTRWAPSTCSAE
jgi:hypothetical protein